MSGGDHGASSELRPTIALTFRAADQDGVLRALLAVRKRGATLISVTIAPHDSRGGYHVSLVVSAPGLSANMVVKILNRVVTVSEVTFGAGFSSAPVTR